MCQRGGQLLTLLKWKATCRKTDVWCEDFEDVRHLAASSWLTLLKGQQCGFKWHCGLYWQKCSIPCWDKAKQKKEQSGTCTHPDTPHQMISVPVRTPQVYFSNVQKPSKVNPCAMHYWHLPPSWEEAQSQLRFLFFTLSAVLSVSVRRVKLKQKKVAGPLILSHLSSSPVVLAGVRDTYKGAEYERADRQLIMSVGWTKH